MLTDHRSVLSVCDVGVYGGKTVGWINLKLGTEVRLDPSNIALDGEPAPNFGPCLLWPNGWIDQDATSA